MNTADNMAEALRQLEAAQQTEDDQYWDPIERLIDDFDLSYCPVMAKERTDHEEQ